MFKSLSPFIGTRNRELVSLVLWTFYTRNFFHVLLETNHFHSSWIPPPAYAGLIRHLRVQARDMFPEFTWDDDLVNGYCWSHLFTPKGTLEAPSVVADSPATENILKDNPSQYSAAWQAKFPNLQSLTVTFELPPYRTVRGNGRSTCRECQIGPGYWEHFLESLEDAELHLQAPNVEIAFGTTYDCSRPTCLCPERTCDCAELSRRAVLKMATKPRS